MTNPLTRWREWQAERARMEYYRRRIVYFSDPCHGMNRKSIEIVARNYTRARFHLPNWQPKTK